MAGIVLEDNFTSDDRGTDRPAGLGRQGLPPLSTEPRDSMTFTSYNLS